MKIAKLEVTGNGINQAIDSKIKIMAVVEFDMYELYLNNKILNSDEIRHLVAERISERIMEELIKRGDI